MITPCLRVLFFFMMIIGSLSAVDKDPWGEDIPDAPWMGQGWPLRMRVCADYTAGIAWRLPYELVPHDQALAKYQRVRSKLGYLPSGRSIDGRQSVTMNYILEWETAVGAELISEPVLTLAENLATFGNRVTGQTLNWQPYDYYAVRPDRPFAAVAWAPALVIAAVGESKGMSVLVVSHPLGTGADKGFTTAAILRGDMAAHRELLDGVQVLAADRKGRLRTWAEGQSELGFALTKDGKPIKTVRAAVAWQDGYEWETRHYHLTGNSSPARLSAHAADLEALYTTYQDFFQTSGGAPLKFEVHITNTWQEFSDLSTACKNPLHVPAGSVMGGFFMPLCQSLWIYEESGVLGGPPMSIEHVMCHECSHQFLHMACNGSDHVPTWINEGIAVHFENGILANGRYRHQPPVERIKRLASLYKTNKTTLQPMNVYLDHHGSIGADLYGEVYAMVHFWAFGAPGGREHFLAYWKALCAGEDGLVAFERIFTTDLVKAAGSRQIALDRWREQLTTYVQRELTKLK